MILLVSDTIDTTKCNIFNVKSNVQKVGRAKRRLDTMQWKHERLEDEIKTRTLFEMFV